MKKSLLIPIIGALFLTPAMALSHSNTVNAAKSKGTITILNAYNDSANIYSKNNKRLTQYKGKEKPTLASMSKVKYYGKKGSLYNIGHGGYVRSRDVGYVNDYPVLKVASNAFVYNKHGKRIKHFYSKKKNTVIKKGSTVVAKTKIKKLNNIQQNLINGKTKRYYFYNCTALQLFGFDQIGTGAWLPYRTIKQKDYYNIGNGGYIKAANISEITHKQLLVSSKKINVFSFDKKEKFVPIYNHKFYIIKNKRLKSDQDIVSDYFIFMPQNDSDEYTFYHIKGTKDEYVYERYVGRIYNNRQSLDTRLDYSFPPGFDDKPKDGLNEFPS